MLWVTLFVLHLLNLVKDALEDLVGGEIVEFSKTRVHTLRVLVADVLVAVRFEHALGLAVEDDLLQLSGVDLL